MNKLKINLPIIVEGRYDKHRLCSIVDAHIITTDGFGIFNESEKRALLRRLAGEGGVIVMTDSDGAGLLIRSYLRSVLPAGSIKNVYIPRLPGRERRKAAPSKEGLLGVEGMDNETIIALLSPFAGGGNPRESGETLTKAGFFADGFSGGEGSASRRAELAKELGLPQNLSANAIIEAVNLLGIYGQYRAAAKKLRNGGEPDCDADKNKSADN